MTRWFSNSLSLNAIFLVPTLWLVTACGSSDETSFLPSMNLDPETISLETVPTGAPTTAAFSITNSGNGDMIVEAAKADGICEVDTAPLPFPLNPGESKTLELSCTAVTDGDFTSSILVASLNGSATLTVTGTAVVPQVRLRPDQLDLGTVPAGQKVAATIAVESVGSGPLDVTGVVFDQAGWSANTETSLPLRVPPGLSLLVDIAITPRTEGVLHAIATVQTGTDGAGVTLPVQVTATAPLPGTVLPPETTTATEEGGGDDEAETPETLGYETGRVSPGDPRRVCTALWGSDLGHVPPYPGVCDRSKGFRSFNGHCYFAVNKTDILWVDARASCSAAGGYLVTISDANELDFVIQMNSYPYIGSCDSDSEGTFVWLTGESWSWNRWNPGEPNDFGPGEDCGEATASGFNDVLCETYYKSKGFVCEFE